MTGATGTTPTCSWTDTAAAVWAAALVVFKAPAPALVAVPDVVADQKPTQPPRSPAAGLTVGTVTTVLSAIVPGGHVISQSPAAGTLVAPGSAVDLVLAVDAGPGRHDRRGRPAHPARVAVDPGDGQRPRSACRRRCPLPTVAPDVRQEIVVTFDGVRIFGGLVDTVIQRAGYVEDRRDDRSSTRSRAADFNTLADWRLGQRHRGPAETLKAHLDRPGAVPARRDAEPRPGRRAACCRRGHRRSRRCPRCSTKSATITGYVWNIDYHGVLTMWQPGLEAAPFDILDSNDHAKGDIIVEPIATEYATTILLVAGDTAAREVVPTRSRANGTATVVSAALSAGHRMRAS